MEHHDVIVIGGGAAGLSGALTLGRSRRSVLVIDAGEPRNAPADAAHNVLTRDGTPPRELLALGRAEVARYGVEVVDGRVVAARGEEGDFTVELADGSTAHARRLLLATGLTDELPAIEGRRERWGRDAVHCPYCHGYEVRDRPIVVLGGAFGDLHRALMFRQLSDDVTLLVAAGSEPDEEDAALLGARDVAVVVGEATALETTDDALTGVLLADGRRLAAGAVAVAPRFTANTELVAGLGLATAPHAMGEAVGEHVVADPMGLTERPGVFVAGNVANELAVLTSAMDAGVMVGARINGDLVMDDARRALADRAVAAA